MEKTSQIKYHNINRERLSRKMYMGQSELN